MQFFFHKNVEIFTSLLLMSVHKRFVTSPLSYFYKVHHDCFTIQIVGLAMRLTLLQAFKPIAAQLSE